MYRGVQQKQELLFRDSLGARRRLVRSSGEAFLVGLLSFGLLSILTVVSSVLGVNGAIGLGSSAGLFVLCRSTITNTDYHA